MAISLVQKSSVATASNLGPSGHLQVSLTGTAAGNTLILSLVFLDDSNLSSQCGTVSDGTNTWNNSSVGGDNEKTFNHQQSSIYSAYNIAGGNVTVTIPNNGTSTSAYMAGVLYEISGVAASGVNDAGANATAGQNSNNPMTSTGSALANSGDILFGNFCVNDNANTLASGSGTPAGWTNDGVSMVNYPAYGFAHFSPGATTAVTANFGTLTSSDNWTTVQAGYQPASSASSFRRSPGLGTRTGSRQAR